MAFLSRRTPERNQARDARRAAVRGRIVEATEELVREGSTYAALSIETIACRAGISRTTFYDYFPDKRELLLAITKTVLREELATVTEWRPGDDNDATRADLRRIINAFVRIYEHPAVRAIIEATYYDEEVNAAWAANQNQHIERAIRLLQAERDAGRLKASDRALEARARALHWSIHATIFREVTIGGPLDRDDMVDALVEINILGVRGVLP
jgi:AcrR family transcriptional regulator